MDADLSREIEIWAETTSFLSTLTLCQDTYLRQQNRPMVARRGRASRERSHAKHGNENKPDGPQTKSFPP